MNVYQIEFNEPFEVNKYRYVLAKTFEEAFLKAQKILARWHKETKDIELLSIQFECEIADVEA